MKLPYALIALLLVPAVQAGIEEKCRFASVATENRQVSREYEARRGHPGVARDSVIAACIDAGHRNCAIVRNYYDAFWGKHVYCARGERVTPRTRAEIRREICLVATRCEHRNE